MRIQTLLRRSLLSLAVLFSASCGDSNPFLGYYADTGSAYTVNLQLASGGANTIVGKATANVEPGGANIDRTNMHVSLFGMRPCDFWVIRSGNTFTIPQQRGGCLVQAAVEGTVWELDVQSGTGSMSGSTMTINFAGRYMPNSRDAEWRPFTASYTAVRDR